ncbi:hypothetical protein MKW94_000245 [Papaver nudicaule]|uniref:Uncharacterized protein n=1 Tax=Papaver nudicaule TaxID=74823 RepID=A0AA42B5G5_PAPNU|nr:hypothetical protein [Papaver nudicaule]
MEISTTLSLKSISITSSYSSSTLSSSKSLVFSNGGRSNFMNKKSNCLVLNRRSQRGFNCKSMFGLGVPEIVVIAGVATLLFGPKKLPEIGRSFGQTFKSFQQSFHICVLSKSLSSELINFGINVDLVPIE